VRRLANAEINTGAAIVSANCRLIWPGNAAQERAGNEDGRQDDAIADHRPDTSSIAWMVASRD